MRRNTGGVHGMHKRDSTSTGGPTFSSLLFVPKIHPANSCPLFVVDPAVECTAYDYAPVDAIKSKFPTPWDTASIVASDTEAAAIFKTINATLNSAVPYITPHCVAADCHNGDFTGVPYNATDPDCWWSWSECTSPKATNAGIPKDVTTVPEPLTWGLAFDDGPNCSHNAFYDYLMEQNQKATM